MPTDALVTMILAMVLLWGGLAASIGYAVKVGRAAKARAAGERAGSGRGDGAAPPA